MRNKRKGHEKSIIIANGKYGFGREVAPAACMRQWYIWHHNPAPQFQHAAGPPPAKLKTGSGLSEFVYFSLLQWTAGGNRLIGPKCAYELWFKMQLTLSESTGNRHLTPGALQAGKDLNPWVASKAEILFSIILFWRNFPEQGGFAADISLLT